MIIWRYLNLARTYLSDSSRKFVKFCEGSPRGVNTFILYEACNLYGKQIRGQDTYGMALNIYRCLTLIEFYSKTLFKVIGRDVTDHRDQEIDMLKQEILYEPILAQNIITLLWQHEPRMMRNTERYLTKAGILFPKV